eukprot:3931191-Pyramimonas_sp.AAC.1
MAPTVGLMTAPLICPSHVASDSFCGVISKSSPMTRGRPRLCAADLTAPRMRRLAAERPSAMWRC